MVASCVLSEATTFLVGIGVVGCNCAIAALLAAVVQATVVELYGWSRSQ